MVDVARVNLYGQPIGSVRWDQRYEVAQFEYDPDFVRQGIEPSPLMMPVREGRVYSFGELDKTTFKGLHGMHFAGKMLQVQVRQMDNRSEP